MTQQNEALRLADAIDPATIHALAFCRDAAAELRRLHAELERCKQVCAATSESWRADAESWNAQRDALLEALQRALNVLDATGAQDEATAARAAIKAVEEEKT